MARRVTIKGLSGLQSDLDALATDLREGMPKAEEAVAEALAADISVSAPVDTGALRDSVEADDNEVVIGGPRAPYAAEVEESEPFIRPAINRIVRKGSDIAADALRKEIG